MVLLQESFNLENEKQKTVKYQIKRECHSIEKQEYGFMKTC